LPTILFLLGRHRSKPLGAIGILHVFLNPLRLLLVGDWSWPKKCDKPAIEALMSLEFLNEAQRAELDQLRSASLGREKRFERGTRRRRHW
jgi:hypothetical protein